MSVTTIRLISLILTYNYRREVNNRDLDSLLDRSSITLDYI